MRKLKKFKRYDSGGAVGAGSGDPFSYTDFSNRKRAVEAEERKAEKAEESNKPEPVKTESVKPAEIKETKTPEPAKLSKAESRADYEGDADSSTSQTFTPSKPPAASKPAASKPAAPKPAAPKPAADPRDREKGMSRGRTDSGPVAPKAAKSPGPEDIPGTEASKGPKGELIDNSNLPAKQFAQSVLGASPALRGMGAAVRGAGVLGRMLESGSKPPPKVEPKLDSKADTAPAKPAIERVKDAKIEGPPAPPKPKTATEEMGLRDTPSMERMRKAKEAAKEGPPEPLRVKTSAERKGLKETPSMERMRKAKEATKEGPPAPAKAKTPAEEMGLRETSAMEKSRKANEGPPDLGARSRRVAEAQKRSDKIPQKEREPGLMQEYIAGRAAARNRIKDLPNDGLSTPRYDMKKGGKIPAFKGGGMVGRADGCAIRGKTKGRMV